MKSFDTIQVRFNFKDRESLEVREEVKHLNGRCFHVEVGCLFSEDDPEYPGEFMLHLLDDSLPISWIPSGDVEVLQ